MLQRFNKKTFLSRFLKVLSTRTNAWWNEKLNIAPSLIPARWKKGHLPSLQHFIEICETDNLSADWLLFNIGKQNISERDSDFDYEEKDKAYEKILRLKSTNKMLLKENEKLRQILHEMFKVYLASDDGKALVELLQHDQK